MEDENFVANDSVEYLLRKHRNGTSIYRQEVEWVIRENWFAQIPFELQPVFSAAMRGELQRRPGRAGRCYSDLRRLQAAYEFRVADILEERERVGWKRTRGSLTAKEQALEDVALRENICGSSLRNLLSSCNLLQIA